MPKWKAGDAIESSDPLVDLKKVKILAVNNKTYSIKVLKNSFPENWICVNMIELTTIAIDNFDYKLCANELKKKKLQGVRK